MARKYSNNYSTTITTASVSTGDITFDVASITGLPIIGAGDYCVLTITDSLTAPTKTEVVKATSLATNTLTVERAQESTTAQAWVSGDFVELRVTAGSFNTMDGTKFVTYSEQEYAAPVDAIYRNNGGIQTRTLAAPASLAFTLNDGESLSLRLVNTDTYSVAFPSGMLWPNGFAPTLTGPQSWIQIWKTGTAVFGVHIGDFDVVA